jgi:hypothetical protein
MNDEKSVEVVLKEKALNEKIGLLKKKHNVDHIWHLSIPAEEGEVEHDFFFNKPDRAVMSAAMKASKDDDMKFPEIIIENCLLDGDKDALDDIGIFVTVSEKLEKLIGKRAADLKKY